MNSAIVNVSGESHLITLNPEGFAIMEKNGKQVMKLSEERVNSFDVLCSYDGCIHFFYSTVCGVLEYLKIKGDTTENTFVTKTKKGNGISQVNVLYVQGRFHIFYCADGDKSYLIHQVLWEDGLYEPHIVDAADKDFAFSVICDCNSDIHIVYRDNDKKISYVRYAYSLKKYSLPVKTALNCAGKIELCICRDRLFGAYIKKSGGHFGMYVASIPDCAEQKVAFVMSKNARIALNNGEDGMTLHFAEGGMCYEINLDSRGNASKEKCIGKSFGIFKICSMESNIRYPAGRGYYPIKGYANHIANQSFCGVVSKPLKNEMKDFSKDNGGIFFEKAFSAFMEETEKRLSNLENAVWGNDATFRDTCIRSNDTKNSAYEYTETTEGGME